MKKKELNVDKVSTVLRNLNVWELAFTDAVVKEYQRSKTRNMLLMALVIGCLVIGLPLVPLLHKGNHDLKIDKAYVGAYLSMNRAPLDFDYAQYYLWEEDLFIMDDDAEIYINGTDEEVY